LLGLPGDPEVDGHRIRAEILDPTQEEPADVAENGSSEQE
jgi:hypothetical protein